MSQLAPIHLPPTEFDKRVADACYRLADPKVEPIVRVITWLADEKIMVAGAALAWLGMRRLSRDETARRQADQMLSSIAIAAAVPHVLKLLFTRKRPDRTRVHGPRKGIPKSGEAFDSFPSGHAVHVGALAGALTRIRPQSFWSIWSAAFALAGTRVVLLAHHVTDVVAGLLLGLAINSAVERIALVALLRNLYPSSRPNSRGIWRSSSHY